MKGLSSARRGLGIALVGWVILVQGSSCRDTSSTTVELSNTVELQIGESLMRVSVADTPEERANGYFDRDAPGDGEGILFVFEREGTYGFIMSDGQRRVPYELGIAFIDASGRVTEVRRLAGGSTECVDSPEKTLYAVEGSWQYYQKAPIRAGMRVRGLPAR